MAQRRDRERRTARSCRASIRPERRAPTTGTVPRPCGSTASMLSASVGKLHHGSTNAHGATRSRARDRRPRSDRGGRRAARPSGSRPPARSPPASPAMTPEPVEREPAHTWATRPRPPITSPSAGQTRRRTGSCQAKRAHSAISTGRGELEQQADPDRQPVDRDEVEPLHEREADDAVEREPAELAARPDAAAAPGATTASPSASPTNAPVERSSVQRRRADVADVQRELRDGPVDREQRRGERSSSRTPARGRRRAASVPGGRASSVTVRGYRCPPAQ